MAARDNSIRVTIAAVAALVVATVLVFALRDDPDDPGRSPDQVIATISGGTAAVVSDAVWSADGTRLFVVDGGGIAILSGAPLAPAGRVDVAGSGGGSFAATWSPDRTRVVLSSGAQPGAVLVDLAAGTQSAPIDTGASPAHPAWSPGGAQFATAGPDGAVALHDGGTGAVTSSFSPFDTGATPLGLAWPTADRIVVAAGNVVAAFTAPGGEPLWTRASDPSGLLAPSPDGASVVVGQRRTAAHDVHAVADGEVLGEVEIASQELLRVDWSPDGAWLFAAGDDERPRLWDATAAVTRDEYPELSPYGAGGAWAPDARRLAISDASAGTVTVFDVTGALDDEDLDLGDAADAGAAVTTDGDPVIEATAWAPAGDRLAAVTRDGIVHVWVVTPATSG